MKILIQKDYLIFPVNTRVTEKALIVSHEREIAFQLKIRLDNTSPDFYAYIDVSLFKGEFLELSVEPEMSICFSEADTIPDRDLYREAVRPQIHYTVKSGWMGVPEALFRADGAYVMLYPCNPADVKEGNSLWGKAISRDLIHWTEEQTPVVPENNGVSLRRAARICAEETTWLRMRASEEKADPFALVDANGVRKWVSFTENGGYLVGDRKNGVFVPTQSEKKLRYGDSSKGATFVDSETGRAIHVEWDSCRTARFGGQMSIPMELSLEKAEDGYDLLANPAEELEALYKSTNRYRKLTLSAEKEKTIPLADAAQTIRICGESSETGVLTAILFGREICVDLHENRIELGDMKIPISVSGGKMDVTLIVDRNGAEVFADGGRIYSSCLSDGMFMDRNLLSLILRCDTEYCIDLLEIHSLESAW